MIDGLVQRLVPTLSGRADVGGVQQQGERERAMRKTCIMITAMTLSGPAAWPAQAHFEKCPLDAVKVGDVCVDKYEASVWYVPATNRSRKDSKKLVERILKGEVALTDLRKAGATQLGCTDAPFNLARFPAIFPENGNWTPDPHSPLPPSPGVYAVSIAGVLPSTCITWFQAEQACALSGKRLLTNQEWQRAAHGTPDPGTDNRATDCVVASPAPSTTGARAACASSWGVHDMVGNVWEWVADWGERSSACSTWIGNDTTCFGESGAERSPGVIMRGGLWDEGVTAGVFAAWMNERGPLDSGNAIGFRCGR
jgi:formylglycine-generating enzyme required for sulfatase activity